MGNAMLNNPETLLCDNNISDHAPIYIALLYDSIALLYDSNFTEIFIVEKNTEIKKVLRYKMGGGG